MLPHHAEGVGVARKRSGDASVAEEQQRVYSSRIIKAGALLADTTTLLASWNNTQSTEQNLARLQRENVFGKASRSRIADVLAISPLLMFHWCVLFHISANFSS